MSSVEQQVETQQQQQKGQSAFLSQEERSALQRMLGHPEDLPDEFKSWIIDFIAVNIPLIPISQISGFNRFGQLDYAELTTDATVSATAETNPTDIVSLPAREYDGKTTIEIAFYSAVVQPGGGAVILNLWDGSTDLGRIAGCAAGVAQYVTTLLNPSRGSHTYKIRGWRLVSDGTIFGSPPRRPTFIRSSRVIS